MPSSEASDRGNAGERAAARKYGLQGVDESTGYYDLRASNGVRYQVKSCQHTRASGNPGKFRFWRDHLLQLHADQSAVLLVLTASNDAGRVLKVEKVPTSVVVEAVDGRWFPSGHADEGEQYKIPWPDLVSY